MKRRASVTATFCVAKTEETKVEQRPTRDPVERARKAQSPSAGAAAKAGAKTLIQSEASRNRSRAIVEKVIQLQGVQDRHPGQRRRLSDAWMIVEPEVETAADGEAAAAGCEAAAGGEPAAGDEPAAGAMEVEAA